MMDWWGYIILAGMLWIIWQIERLDKQIQNLAKYIDDNCMIKKVKKKK